MQVVKSFNGHRNCLESDLEATQEILKEALALGLLPEGRRMFLGQSSRVFAVLRGDIITTHYFRENWNGFHDMAAYRLPTWELVGTYQFADPAEGRHRNTVTID